MRVLRQRGCHTNECTLAAHFLKRRKYSKQLHCLLKSLWFTPQGILAFSISRLARQPGVIARINYYAATRYLLITFLALASSACGSGSGSGPAAYLDISGESISLTITSPASGGYVETSDSSVTLVGTAGSDTNIVSVTWVNDRGWQGNANGSESWKTDSIPLEMGENNITVTAQDSSGATTSRTVIFKRESGQPGSVTLSWSAPTARTDGSPLTNLAGYKIFYGRMSGIYDYQIRINNPGILTYVVENLVSGDWYFALAAYDSQGLESDRSNEVLREIS